MAISYDSNGNPKVDFAWGNFPMQPDTERGPIVPVVKNAYAYDPINNWVPITSDSNAFVAADITLTDAILPGYAVDVTTYDGNTVLFSGTVKEVFATSSASGLILVEDYLPAYNTIFDSHNVAGTSPKIKVYPKLNTGGGANDKGWSTTTKVKSDLLDLALDGHAITHQKWNGYPGYVPNVSSLSLWEGVLHPAHTVNMRFQGTTISMEQAEIYAGAIMPGKQGYVLRITEPTTDANTATLKGYVDSDEIIGKTVDAMTVPIVQTIAGMNTAGIAELPAGHVVAASAVTDPYNNNVIVMTVFTGDLQNFPTAYWYDPSRVTEEVTFVIGAGSNKNIIFKGVVEQDFDHANTTFTNGIVAFNLLASDMNTNPISGDALALLSTDLTGALLGIKVPLSVWGGPIGMDYNAYSYAYELVSSFGNSSMTGTPGISFVTSLPVNGMFMGGPGVYSYDTGYTVYIVK